MKLKKFIEKNLSLIKDNNFTDLYDEALVEGGMLSSNLTEFLLSCDINPLLYMRVVPDTYLSYSNLLDKIIIPNNIDIIGVVAFSDNGKVKEIIIQDGVTTIQGRAFESCKNLNNVYIGKDISRIGWESFANCPKLTDIYYNGTQEEWDKIKIEEDAIPEYVKIHFKE